MSIRITGCIFLTLFCLACASCRSVFATTWDLEYWQYFNWKNWESGKYKLYTSGWLRANREVSRIYYYRISENFAYQALPCLDLEAHYTFIYQKPRGATHFANTHRLELEAHLIFRLDHDSTLRSRNRLELRKKQQVSHIQFVYRQRLTAAFPIKNCGKLKSIGCYDEFFYDFDTHKFNENRFVPLQLSFELGKRTGISVFFMVRHFFTSSKWYRSWVLGSELEF